MEHLRLSVPAGRHMKDLAVDDVTLIYTKLTDRLAFEHQPTP